MNFYLLQFVIYNAKSKPLQFFFWGGSYFSKKIERIIGPPSLAASPPSSSPPSSFLFLPAIGGKNRERPSRRGIRGPLIHMQGIKNSLRLLSLVLPPHRECVTQLGSPLHQPRNALYSHVQCSLRHYKGCRVSFFLALSSSEPVFSSLAAHQ